MASSSGAERQKRVDMAAPISTVTATAAYAGSLAEGPETDVLSQLHLASAGRLRHELEQATGTMVGKRAPLVVLGELAAIHRATLAALKVGQKDPLRRRDGQAVVNEWWAGDSRWEDEGPDLLYREKHAGNVESQVRF